jgi:hypothetical protein
MKTTRIISAIAAAAAIASFAVSPASANTTDTSTVTVSGAQLAFLGNAAPVGSAERTIVINADTKYVNVEGGSTVRFVIDGQSFAWSFQTGGSHISPFDLARLAPAGALNHKVIVYVSNDPLYMG